MAGRPLITYPLGTLRRLQIAPVVVVVGYQADAVRAACAPFGVRFADQTQPRGTGDAARVALSALPGFEDDLLIAPGDLPLLKAETLEGLVAAHQRAGACVSLLTAKVDDPSGFGRIVRDDTGHITKVVEERDASAAERAIREINVGVYCADAAFLLAALEQLRPNNAQGELYLTDIIAIAHAQHGRIADAPAAAAEASQISCRADLAAREKTLREQICRKWMAAGVTFEDPDTAYIGPEVVIGRDTVIGPGVTLRGTTKIGKGCRMDGNALITDTVVGNKVHVKFGVVITEAVLDDEVQVGPFAHVRPGTHLGLKVHIGDFVETKNADIGARTKAMHLAYLGDTDIGEDTNIGAGTITCNYDGFRKYHTTIGKRVQVGSDSQLVAPVTVGDDAYVATSTTVMKDVPAGALVFTSKRQLQRPGWVAARRAREGITVPGPEADTTPQRPSGSASPPKTRRVARNRIRVVSRQSPARAKKRRR